MKASLPTSTAVSCNVAAIEEHAEPPPAVQPVSHIETKVPPIQRYGEWVQKLNSNLNDYAFVPLFLHVADHPYWYILPVIIVSITLPTIAVLTNSISIETSTIKTSIPQNSYTSLQTGWLNENFAVGRTSRALLHYKGGQSVLTEDSIRAAFDVSEALVTLQDYDAWCIDSNSTLSQEHGFPRPCSVHSITLFWRDRHEFEVEMSNLTTTSERNERIQQRVSVDVFPNGKPAVRAQILGRTTKDESGKILSAQSILTTKDRKSVV